MDSKDVEINIREGIATVALSRKESLNALSLGFTKEIARAMQKLAQTDDVRVIILKSNARIFCAGLDLKDMMVHGLDAKARAALNMPERYDSLFDCVESFEKCRKPVIAAVHGKCIGGGLDIATACDIRLCTKDAVFSLREAAIGLAADMGVLQRLPLIVGQGHAREMAFTAGNYSSEKALNMGLVTAVYNDQAELIEAAEKLAAGITANAPLAVEASKDVLNYSRNVSVQAGVSYAQHKNMVLMGSRDLMEAAAAFMEKRKPEFKGE